MARKIKSFDDTRSIDLEDQHAIDFWARQFSVTQVKLKTVVGLVGTNVADVKRMLKK